MFQLPYVSRDHFISYQCISLMLEQGKKGKTDSEYYTLKAQWSVDYFVTDEMAKH